MDQPCLLWLQLQFAAVNGATLPLLLLLLCGVLVQTITEAYHVLRDSKKRQLYDAGQYRA